MTVWVVRERPEKGGRFTNRPYEREFTWTPDASLGSGVYFVRARFDSAQRPEGQTVTKPIVYLK